MPRISRDEHAKIYERVEVNGEKVAAVAASYRCTSANIYTIIAKHRRSPALAPQSDEQERSRESVVPPLQLPLDVEGSTGSAGADVPISVSAVVPEPKLDLPASLSQAAAPAKTTIASSRAQPSVSGPFVVGRNKGGFALMMRGSEGEEIANPFRSLEDLLAAAKPILRTAARSPEPIWFSIRPVDLEALQDIL